MIQGDQRHPTLKSLRRNQRPPKKSHVQSRNLLRQHIAQHHRPSLQFRPIRSLTSHLATLKALEQLMGGLKGPTAQSRRCRLGSRGRNPRHQSPSSSRRRQPSTKFPSRISCLELRVSLQGSIHQVSFAISNRPSGIPMQPGGTRTAELRTAMRLRPRRSGRGYGTPDHATSMAFFSMPT